VRVKDVENFNSSRDGRLTTHFSITTTNNKYRKSRLIKNIFNAVGLQKIYSRFEVNICAEMKEKREKN
jgi:hypothetical protein